MLLAIQRPTATQNLELAPLLKEIQLHSTWTLFTVKTVELIKILEQCREVSDGLADLGMWRLRHKK
jgi:hypothetical protein